MIHAALSHPQTTERSVDDLRPPEARLLAMLRLWHLGPEAQAIIWTELNSEIGALRARACLTAFEDLHKALARYSWQALSFGHPQSQGLTRNEDDILRFVMAATEQDRDMAMLLASYLVRPEALMGIVQTAMRCGLPLLCSECRAQQRPTCRQN